MIFYDHNNNKNLYININLRVGIVGIKMFNLSTLKEYII